MASTTITEDTSFSMKAGISSRRAMVYTRRKAKAPTTMPMARLRMLPFAQQHLAHEQGGQGNGHHAGADVNADGLLTLGQQAAGQTREGVGHAQAHDGGKGGIDRGGADHIGIVAGGADGQAQAGAQKQGQKTTTAITAMTATKQLILLRKDSALQQGPGLGEHGLGFVHVQQGRSRP